MSPEQTMAWEQSVEERRSELTAESPIERESRYGLTGDAEFGPAKVAARIAGEMLVGMNPVMGPAIDFAYLKQAYDDESVGDAAWAGVGLIPIVGDVAGGARRAAKGAKTAAKTALKEAAKARHAWRTLGTESPYFQKWFGNSKVVDEAGSPLVVYHGGADIEGGTGVFRSSQRGALGKGVYFTPDKGRAEYYAREHIMRGPDSAAKDDWLPKGTVTEVYLNIQKPLVLSRSGRGHPVVDGFEQLGMDRRKAERLVEYQEEEYGYIAGQLQKLAKEKGYDGIIQMDRSGETISEILVFEPTQIKSKANRGAFDPYDPNIQAALQAEPQTTQRA